MFRGFHSAAAVAATACVASAIIAGSASANPWIEAGEAGQTSGAAQQTIGVPGPLTSISGSFASGADSDVYVIRISNAAAFSAITSSLTPDADHQIQLFNLNGSGIAFNDDDPAGVVFTSALPAGNALYNSLAPGLYLLGISEWDNDPFIVANPQVQADYVFPFNSAPQNRQVSGPNAGSVGVPFIDYDTTFGPALPDGPYTIALTGAEFAVVPEPASLGAIGMIALLGVRRRRAS